MAREPRNKCSRCASGEWACHLVRGSDSAGNCGSAGTACGLATALPSDGGHYPHVTIDKRLVTCAGCLDNVLTSSEKYDRPREEF